MPFFIPREREPFEGASGGEHFALVFSSREVPTGEPLCARASSP